MNCRLFSELKFLMLVFCSLELLCFQSGLSSDENYLILEMLLTGTNIYFPGVGKSNVHLTLH